MGFSAIVLGQDDFFRLPPRSNHARRMEDISWVGPGEVRLDRLSEVVAALVAQPADPVDKPLVIFDADRITEEEVPPGPWHVVIAGGTSARAGDDGPLWDVVVIGAGPAGAMAACAVAGPSSSNSARRRRSPT